MTIEQTKQIIQLLSDKGVLFDSGLTDNEVLQVETKFKFKFPPDLKLFLQLALPISDNFVNWRLGVANWRHGLKSHREFVKINERLNRPLEGMLLDLQSDDFWINSWGNKPNTYKEKAKIAKQMYSTFPKLIPIYSHRYIPTFPLEEGNPIFSVHQMDIIYYGYNLAEYLSNEFHFILPDNIETVEQPKNIKFWSNWVDEWTEN